MDKIRASERVLHWLGKNFLQAHGFSPINFAKLAIPFSISVLDRVTLLAAEVDSRILRGIVLPDSPKIRRMVKRHIENRFASENGDWQWPLGLFRDHSDDDPARALRRSLRTIVTNSCPTFLVKN